MNMAMTLTLDGLVRALRSRAHDLAEDIERGYREDIRASRPVRDDHAGMNERARGESDDRTGR